MLTEDNVIQYIRDCTYEMANTIEEFKDEVTEEFSNFTNFELAFFICGLTDEIFGEKNSFNFYFPFEYRCISEYLVTFSKLFTTMPNYEIHLMRISIRLQAIVEKTMLTISSMPVKNPNSVYKVFMDYRNNKFEPKRKKLLFEKKLDPDLDTEEFKLMLIEKRIINEIECLLTELL